MGISQPNLCRTQAEIRDHLSKSEVLSLEVKPKKSYASNIEYVYRSSLSSKLVSVDFMNKQHLASYMQTKVKCRCGAEIDISGVSLVSMVSMYTARFAAL